MVVERARGESQSTSGSLQSLCWGSSAFGGVVSAYFSGSLVDTYGVRFAPQQLNIVKANENSAYYRSLIRHFPKCRFVFGVTAFLPLMTSAVAVLVNEHRLPSRERSISFSGSGLIESSSQQIRQIWTAVKQPNIFLPTLFIFLWQATPQSDSAMFFFVYVPRTRDLIILVAMDCCVRHSFYIFSKHNFGFLKKTQSLGY